MMKGLNALNPYSDYLDGIIGLVEQVKTTQAERFAQAAEKLSDAVIAGKLIYLWGPGGHSSIFAEDAMYRKGELAAVCPIYDPNISLSHGAAREINNMERVKGFAEVIVKYHGIGEGDVVVMGSAYGINPVVIEATLLCRQRGAYVIAVTSPSFSNQSTFTGGRHKSGMNLYDAADLYIDSFVPYGDAILSYEELDAKIAPVATIMQAIVLKALMAETMMAVKRKGGDPFVWTNSLQAGGIEANSAYMKQIWGKVKSM